MFMRKLAIATSLFVLTSGPVLADQFLVHITSGPDNPTEAALGFLVALTAMNEGHDVNIFLAGDGAALITDDALSSVEGVGTGKLQEHFDALIAGEAKIYISGMSARAREITEEDLEGKSAEFAMPAMLVQLAADADVVLVY